MSAIRTFMMLPRLNLRVTGPLLGVLLLLALLIPFPVLGQSGDPVTEAQAAIFGVHPPKHYRVYQGGPLPDRLEQKGYYVVMRNTRNKTLALVIRSATADSLESAIQLLRPDLIVPLTARLFQQYVGCGQVTQIEPVRVRSQKGLPVYWMRIGFADGFIEPDIVTRWPDGQNGQITVMLGRPDEGGVGTSHYFLKQYRQMMHEARRIARRVAH